MKRRTVVLAALAVVLLVAGCSTERYAQNYRGRSVKSDSLSHITTQDVIALTKAGVSDTLIVTMIDASGSYFRVNAKDVIDLKNAGVSDNVVSRMFTTYEPAEYDQEPSGYYYPYWYPPNYWYADYPFYSPWYPRFYFGFSGRYFRPSFAHRMYFPHFSSPPFRGAYGGHSSGGMRGPGRRR